MLFFAKTDRRYDSSQIEDMNYALPKIQSDSPPKNTVRIEPQSPGRYKKGVQQCANLELLAIRIDNIHFPVTRLIVLENTHNLCNGSPLTLSYLKQVGEIAHGNGLKLHVDGARIFNAAIALGVSPADLSRPADSISFCLSKGLAAPVGSVVCGSETFIAKARRMRKVLGGGMRQAGIIAAAGIVALEQMVERLSEDHDNARRLAEGLADLEGLSLGDLEQVKTNIIYIDLTLDLSAYEAVQKLERAGVRVNPVGSHRLRAVTHHGITAEDVDTAVAAFRKIFAGSTP